jgi:hypothetical protein
MRWRCFFDRFFHAAYDINGGHEMKQPKEKKKHLNLPADPVEWMRDIVTSYLLSFLVKDTMKERCCYVLCFFASVKNNCFVVKKFSTIQFSFDTVSFLGI